MRAKIRIIRLSVVKKSWR